MYGHWRCPYCETACTLQVHNIACFRNSGHVETIGHSSFEAKVIICPNKDCLKHTIMASFEGPRVPERKQLKYQWALLPESAARSFPDCIPAALRSDYHEACLIKDKSPKASATLSRRCLQGMIRDFWDVKARNLYEEIETIKDRIDPATWQAIDSVRQVGNIGAHMERDIDLIIDVDPDEAGLLIELVETLFEEWYIARENRNARMSAVTAIAQKKRELKEAAAGQEQET